MTDNSLFPITAEEVLNKSRAALVKAVESASTSVDNAEAKLDKAQAALDAFDQGIQMNKAEHEQALAELRRDLKRAMAHGADPETGEVK
jgi:flagellar biosynthesis chaperone FliJ